MERDGRQSLCVDAYARPFPLFPRSSMLVDPSLGWDRLAAGLLNATLIICDDYHLETDCLYILQALSMD